MRNNLNFVSEIHINYIKKKKKLYLEPSCSQSCGLEGKEKEKKRKDANKIFCIICDSFFHPKESLWVLCLSQGS